MGNVICRGVFSLEVREMSAIKELDAMYLSVDHKVDEPRSDAEYISLLQQGNAEENIDKIYEFIEACERGRGLWVNESLPELLAKGFEESPEQLMNVLAGKNHFERCVFLASCSVEMKCSFIKLGASENMCYLYECMRQVLNGAKESTEVNSALERGSVLLSAGDRDIWKRWIRRNEYNKKWIGLLGRVLPKLSSEGMSIYAETIRLDMDIKYYRCIYSSLEVMSEAEYKEFCKIIAPIIYRRWKEMLGAKRESGNCQRGLVCTGYGDLVLGAMFILFAEQTDWENELSAEIDRLITDMTAWYSKITEMANVFFLDITQIYYLVYIVKIHAHEVGPHLSEKLGNVKKLMQNFDYLWDRRDEENKKKVYEILNLSAII